MDDFRKTPVNRVRPTAPSVIPQASAQPQPPVRPPVQSPSQPPMPPQPLSDTPGISAVSVKKSPKKRLFWLLGGIVATLLLIIGGFFAWYTLQLSPVDSSNSDKKLITVKAGSAPGQIATLLESEGLIRNSDAFLWYTRFQGVQNKLQAGAYRLSPSESTQQIVKHLTSGKVDTFTITFLPGATVADNRKVLIGAGYSEEEVDAALAKPYDSPLFAGKPAEADLEGYIFGETYAFGTDATVEAILERTFAQFYKVVQDNNLVARFEAQGLTLYEGITLASIVQREASPQADDMPQIAQVFYSRLATGMPLGSDVTYQYIADKEGLTRDPNLDSPYNTRRYAGLPPGPISAPGEKALKAAANPAEGDYLYFLSGDDDVTYFARTLDEHEANIANHCREKCKII